MQPDDPRHSDQKGYSAGCRDECCRRAHMVYMKRYRMGGPQPLMSPLGLRRRVEALEAIGWSRADISRAMGRDRTYIGKLLATSELIQGKTLVLIGEVYDRLSMVVPVDPEERPPGKPRVHDAARRRAARRGYAPPLAWDDIDDPDEQPDRGAEVVVRFVKGNTERTDAMVEDAEWLSRAGESLTTVCIRLNVKAETLYQACRRSGRNDLYAALAGREPDGLTRREAS